MHDYYSTFGYIQTYASTDVGVFWGKMCKTSLFFYFPLSDAVSLSPHNPPYFHLLPLHT